MSRVDALANAKDSVSVKFLEFTRIASKGKVSVFFEGDDEKYYSSRINAFASKIQWVGVICKGKASVIQLREDIRTHIKYASSTCMFFIDSDFDDNNIYKQFKDIYVTPCYSVENLYCSNDVFCRILSAEFGINETHTLCYTKALNIFKQTKDQYLKAIAPFNCLIRELRIMESDNTMTFTLNLNNVQLDNLVEINLGNVEKKYNEQKHSKILPDIPVRLIIDLSNSQKHFVNLNGELWFRGKQNLEFMRIFLIKLKGDSGSKRDRQVFQKKTSVALQLTKANCLSELSQYADTPKCLIEFIQRYQKHTTEV